jgi:hypothetical protein
MSRVRCSSEREGKGGRLHTRARSRAVHTLVILNLTGSRLRLSFSFRTTPQISFLDTYRPSCIMKLLPNSTLLCEWCTRMISTLDGLRELASREGYIQLLVEEIHKSAALGCPFCAILKNNHKRSPHPAAYVRVFPRRPMLQDHEVEKYKLQSESTGHPFAIAKLDDLHSTVWIIRLISMQLRLNNILKSQNCQDLDILLIFILSQGKVSPLKTHLCAY